jgi:hypothetical protein
MIIDENTIKKFIEECRVNDFTPNSSGIIENKELSNDIDRFINNIINSMDENIKEEIINKKIKAEINTATVDNRAKMLNIFYLITTSTYNYILSKYYKEDDMYKNVLSNIVHYSLVLFTQIFSLYLSNCPMGIISQTRILYENYIIFNYIGKYPELAQCYYDHAVYKKYILIKEYWGVNLTKEEQNEMDTIKNKYDDTFNDDFGWAFKTINERNRRKIITMAEDLNILDYKELYKVTSNYIHPSSFSVFHTKIIKSLVPNITLMSIEMITNNIIYLLNYYKSDEKDKILIRNVLYGLREDLYNEPKIYKK